MGWRMPDSLSDIFADAEHDGAAWHELRNMYSTWLALLPACEWRPVIAFPSRPEDRHEAKRQIFEAATEANEECARAMLHCNRENEWPELSPQAVFGLTVALDQIEVFLGLCYDELSDGSIVSLFPYSGQTEGALIQWMFFRWWTGPGVRHWMSRIVQDRRLFDSYFDAPS
jgi:hypothetical protein